MKRLSQSADLPRLLVLYGLLACCGCVGDAGTRRLVDSGGVTLVAPESLTDLKPGMSVAAVRAATGCAGQHQFTLERSGHRWWCICHYPRVDPSPDVELAYYLVFRDDRLLKIVSPSAGPQAGATTTPSSLDLEGVLRRVWSILDDVPSESRNQIELAVAQQAAAVRTRRQREGEPFLPLAVPIALLVSLNVETVAQRNQALSRRFAGDDLPLGATPGSIACHLGSPRRQEPYGTSGEAGYYWGDLDGGEARLRREYTASGIVVVYRRGAAQIILSHDFFPWRSVE